MNINVTDADIKAWIKLAKTDITMRSKLLECATVYALAAPEGTKVTQGEENTITQYEKDLMRQAMMSQVRYK
jgi:hypothetical protein